MTDPRVWSKEDLLKMWPQAAGELRGFQHHLEKQRAGITADQIGMAIQLGNAEFERLQKEQAQLTPARKAEWIMHHDDSPCTARLENGYCPKCRFVPDMQSTCFYFYCPDCKVQLNKITCPQCEKTFKRE